MSKLKPCPCGKIPEALIIVENGQGAKWAVASGDCCGEWMIEFRTHYNKFGSKECRDLANAAWNEAPRAQQKKPK